MRRKQLPEIVTTLLNAPEKAGWAATTLHQALYLTVLQATAALSAVLTVAILLTPATSDHRWWLLPMHMALVAGSLAASSGRFPVVAIVVFVAIVVPVDTAVTEVTESPVTIATIWLLHIAQFLPVAMAGYRTARALSWALSLLPLSLLSIRPDWAARIVIPWTVTSVALAFVAWAVIPRLVNFAESIDADLDASWEERRSLAAAAAASADAAEAARTLHDTAINTLAAVASGGAAVADQTLVQERCARDLETLDRIVAGTDPSTPVLSLRQIADETSLRLDRRGLDDMELAQVTEDLPPNVLRALQGAVREAVRNAEEHADTSTVVVDANIRGSKLVIDVSDSGRGFETELPAGRGLAESVVARTAAAGVSAAVESEPGSGTQIRLEYPLPGARPDPATDDPAPATDPRSVTERIIRRACWVWCGGVVAVGVVIEAFGRPGSLSIIHGMLAVVAVVSVLARLATRHRDTLPASVSAVAVASTPVVFVLVVAGLDFGRDDPTSWQALAVTPCLVLPLVFGRTRRPFILSLVAVITTSAVTTAVVAQDAPAAAAFLPIGTAPAVLAGLGWARFRNVVELVGERLAHQDHLVAVARVEQTAREAAAAARQRWRMAGIVSCRTLLRRLASGAGDPTSPEIRDACAREEEYLRQVCMLEPRLLRLGNHLARALSLARSRGVHLAVRTGQTEVEHDEVAEALGTLLGDSIASVPPGSELTASLFDVQNKLVFGLVGPAPTLESVTSAWTPPSGWSASVRFYGPEGLVEVERMEPPGETGDSELAQSVRS